MENEHHRITSQDFHFLTQAQETTSPSLQDDWGIKWATKYQCAAFQLEVPFLSPSSATTATSPPCFLDGHRQHFYFLPLGRLYEASVRKPNPHEFKAKGNLLGYRVRRSNPDGERGCHQTRLLFSSQLATGGLPGHHTAPSDVTAPASQPPRFNSSWKSKLPSHCCPNLPPKSALILIGPA